MQTRINIMETIQDVDPQMWTKFLMTMLERQRLAITALIEQSNNTTHYIRTLESRIQYLESQVAQFKQTQQQQALTQSELDAFFTNLTYSTDSTDICNCIDASIGNAVENLPLSPPIQENV